VYDVSGGKIIIEKERTVENEGGRVKNRKAIKRRERVCWRMVYLNSTRQMYTRKL
jgi:hypothetical protein